MQNLLMGEVTVPEMMQARDERVLRQQALLAQGGTLICLTMNIPGARKTSSLILIAFREGERQIAEACPQATLAQEVLNKTGFEAYFHLEGDAQAIKRALCVVEDAHPLGRLFDIDVLTAQGEKVSREAMGFAPRKCFLCDQPAFACARSRTHSVAEMTVEIERRITAFYREATVARLSRAAVAALEQEARTTPKPGLVDERNCGSHPDMDLALLLGSARALEEYFIRCAQLGFDEPTQTVFSSLQSAGIQAEQTMFAATGGINTHKGAIFSVGILCAAAARCAADFRYDADAICRMAGEMTAPTIEAYFSSLTTPKTFGEMLYLDHGTRGIRGEVADGFPALRALYYVFEEETRKLSLNEAGARAIIRLLARIQDTTLVKRGGEQGQRFARERAQHIEREGFPREAILALDDAMIARHLTCGGCADLLACLVFLHFTASNGQSEENLP